MHHLGLAVNHSTHRFDKALVRLIDRCLGSQRQTAELCFVHLTDEHAGAETIQSVILHVAVGVAPDEHAVVLLCQFLCHAVTYDVAVAVELADSHQSVG